MTYCSHCLLGYSLLSGVDSGPDGQLLFLEELWNQFAVVAVKASRIVEIEVVVEVKVVLMRMMRMTGEQ